MGNRKSRKTAFETTQRNKSKSRSKSTKKNKKNRDTIGSDEVYDRLSKPVDHTATKKRILKEEKEKLEMSLTNPKSLTRQSSKKKVRTKKHNSS